MDYLLVFENVFNFSARCKKRFIFLSSLTSSKNFLSSNFVKKAQSCFNLTEYFPQTKIYENFAVFLVMFETK